MHHYRCTYTYLHNYAHITHTYSTYDYITYNTKFSQLHGKLLFCLETFAVAHDGPKDYACDRTY